MAQLLETFVDPIMGRTWQELGSIRRAAKLDNKWHAAIELSYPCDGLKDAYQALVSEWIEEEIILELQFRLGEKQVLPGVKNVIAIASGKGGVGKSTTAANIAIALDRAGAKTGLLDADIYGPSQGIMMGVPEGKRPEVRDEKYFVPMRCHGVEAISMSMMVTEKTPMVWRGPMASGALQQLLNQTIWGDIDYLIVDMPPGTGDIQLTLSQQVSVGGAVIVTTPQDIALADARKGIEMFEKVSVPVLGIVENMSYFICDRCSAKHSLFGVGGGELVAQEYNTTVLGEFPLDPMIREQTDAGLPPVAKNPTSEIGSLYIEVARRIAGTLFQSANQNVERPTISMDDQ